MNKLWTACLAAVGIAIAIPAAHADGNNNAPAWIDAQEFATLPEGVRYPEGITANPATGDIFVGTFDGNPAHPNNKLIRLGRNGRVEAQKDFGPQPLLGLGFRAGQVYILNFGAQKLQRIDANFTAATPVEDVATFPIIGPPPGRENPNGDGSTDTIVFNSFRSAPNALVFDRAGNIYVSDSFQGAIYRIPAGAPCVAPACPQVLSHDPLLATPGFPPFGANGLALDAEESVLYIANTGDHRVLKMTLPAAVVSVFTESIHGADGLLFRDGLLWVAANQADTVFALDAKGRYVVRAGEFEGIARNGAPRGLLFPASLVAVDGWMYVTNLALPLTAAVGDEWEEEVSRWNIARFRLPR
jgi:DNA-binding beta-propeller fold protein YncE